MLLCLMLQMCSLKKHFNAKSGIHYLGSMRSLPGPRSTLSRAPTLSRNAITSADLVYWIGVSWYGELRRLVSCEQESGAHSTRYRVCVRNRFIALVCLMHVGISWNKQLAHVEFTTFGGAVERGSSPNKAGNQQLYFQKNAGRGAQCTYYLESFASTFALQDNNISTMRMWPDSEKRWFVFRIDPNAWRGVSPLTRQAISKEHSRNAGRGAQCTYYPES